MATTNYTPARQPADLVQALQRATTGDIDRFIVRRALSGTEALLVRLAHDMLHTEDRALADEWDALAPDLLGADLTNREHRLVALVDALAEGSARAAA